ncbi:P-loop containing nucleoside triphosphate hydrolase protein, partial [Mycena amicta]
MMWFAETFDKSLARSEVEDALARSIDDVIQAISDNLTPPIRAHLNHAQNRLEKVKILFGHLDSQSTNVVLVHAFQHALLKRGGINYMLNSRDSNVQDDIVFIRNCPPPSDFFQGRKDILQQLDHLFQQTEQKEQKAVLLYGLGGTGKTQIALKFIADSGSRFTDQFKINASSAETIEAGYRQLAIDKKLEDTVEAARTWLKANQQEWLILFDNADKRDLNLGPYLPKYHHGNILITSRNPDLWVHTGSPEKAIKISDLTVDDASVLLLNRAGIELESGENKKDAAMIAKELHCFPLAIVQAGAFIGKSPRLKQDISRYVQLYQKNKAKLLSEKPAQSTEDYNETVYTTWRMSFDQLSQLEPLAAQFLQLCSFIHFEGISEDIFERASRYEIGDGPLDPTLEVLKSSFEFLSKFRDADMTWNSLVFENITSELCGYSLMTWQKGGYSIHPLVHQWSRTIITDLVGSQKLMIGLLGMAATCSPEVMQEIQLFLHIVRLSEDIDMIGTGFEAQLGSVFYAGGMYRRAETLQSHVVTKSDSFLGAEHPDTIGAMANLARTYSSLGRYTDAQTLEEKVLEQRTRLLGAEHP